MLSAPNTVEDRRKVLPLPPLPASTEEVSTSKSLGSERHRILQDIHAILSGWYASGAANISIDGIATFDSADRCIAILEHSRLEEIQRVHCLLTGKR